MSFWSNFSIFQFFKWNFPKTLPFFLLKSIKSQSQDIQSTSKTLEKWSFQRFLSYFCQFLNKSSQNYRITRFSSHGDFFQEHQTSPSERVHHYLKPIFKPFYSASIHFSKIDYSVHRTSKSFFKFLDFSMQILRRHCRFLRKISKKWKELHSNNQNFTLTMKVPLHAMNITPNQWFFTQPKKN